MECALTSITYKRREMSLLSLHCRIIGRGSSHLYNLWLEREDTPTSTSGDQRERERERGLANLYNSGSEKEILFIRDQREKKYSHLYDQDQRERAWSDPRISTARDRKELKDLLKPRMRGDPLTSSTGDIEGSCLSYHYNVGSEEEDPLTFTKRGQRERVFSLLQSGNEFNEFCTPNKICQSQFL